jgi:hypothetical protein
VHHEQWRHRPGNQASGPQGLKRTKPVPAAESTGFHLQGFHFKTVCSWIFSHFVHCAEHFFAGLTRLPAASAWRQAG